MRIIIQWLAAAAALLYIAPVTNADVILQYDLSALSPNQTEVQPSFAAANTTGDALKLGPGLGPDSITTMFGANGWQNPGVNDYFSFGFSVESRYKVDLQLLQFRIFVDPPIDLNSTAGPAELGIFSNQDGFFRPLSTFDMTAGNVQSLQVDLSSLSNVVGDVEFKLYATTDIGIDGDPTDEESEVRIGEYIDGRLFRPFQIEGAVSAVPEPAAGVYVFATLLACAVRRRRG